MTNEKKLNEGLDNILYQIKRGVTIDEIKKGIFWIELEQIKAWKSRFGFQFQIYSNDHLIENKPHFHIVKISEGIDCRMFFNGKIYDCKGNKNIDKKVLEAINYFLSDNSIQILLQEFWNQKNPSLKIQN
jgi:hypothetical protein